MSDARTLGDRTWLLLIAGGFVGFFVGPAVPLAFGFETVAVVLVAVVPGVVVAVAEYAERTVCGSLDKCRETAVAVVTGAAFGLMVVPSTRGLLVLPVVQAVVGYGLARAALAVSTDRVGGALDRVRAVGRLRAGDADGGLTSRLAETGAWRERTVTQERETVVCECCGREGVAGVERTTVGGVAGYPLREETETVCLYCED